MLKKWIQVWGWFPLKTASLLLYHLYHYSAPYHQSTQIPDLSPALWGEVLLDEQGSQGHAEVFVCLGEAEPA